MVSPSRVLSAAILVLGTPIQTFGQDFDASWSAPEADRWNYGFNQTTGTRPEASIFGYTGDLFEFDERDGQVIVRFDTSDLVPAGEGDANYQIELIELEITLSQELPNGLDTTQDDWRTYLPAGTPGAIPDADVGRPIELYATGFRNGITSDTWSEQTDFSLVGPFGSGVRTAFAAEIGANGSLNDVSNSITDQRTPVPLAIGTSPGATPGTPLSEGATIRFSFDGGDPDVASWLGSELDSGRLTLSISSLVEAEQEGGDFVEFYMRENPLVTVGVRAAASLRIVGSIGASCTEPGDLNNDCQFTGADIGILLSRWGTDDPDADLNGSGFVNGADFGILLSLF